MAITNGDSVTIEYTGRLDDGTVFDTSRESVAEEAGLTAHQPDREYEPLTVEVGAGHLIEGLDEALVGMDTGTEATVEIPPEKGYGERSDDRIVDHERAVFEEAMGNEDPEVGMHVRTERGHIGEVRNVDSDTVRVDFNHELAGESLEFEVEVVDCE